MKILCVVDYYLPGYKGGGPIRTVANSVDWLGDEFEFYILTRDRDLGDVRAYPDVCPDAWNDVGKARAYYASLQQLDVNHLKILLNSARFDVILLNSFFSTLSVKIAYLHWRGQIPQKPLLVAPRGEFYAGALKIKPLKKKLYIRLSKQLRLYRNVRWLASTQEEANTIRAIFPGAKTVYVAPDLTAKTLTTLPDSTARQFDTLRIVFFSRISPKKNLDGALRILSNVKRPLEFDIYGTLEDEAYWKTCQPLMASLPSHIKIAYKGALEPEQVTTTLAHYHLMFFPTHGENFGHVIWEALYAGVPVLISDQTPWHDLETEQVGWEASLNQPERFVERIEQFSAMSEADLQMMAQRAHDYAVNVSRNEEALEANRRLFLDAVNG